MRKDSDHVQKKLGVAFIAVVVFNIVFITSVNSISVAVKSCMSRTEATQMLNTFILPTTDKGTRIQLSSSWNRNSQLSTMVETKNNTHPVPMAGNDPILYDTYGEFPLHSLDILLDRVEELRSSSIDSQLLQGHPRRTKVVDLGSGCGRLALYMALTRPHWHVMGMEQSVPLHQEAIHAVERTIQLGGPIMKLDAQPLDSGDFSNNDNDNHNNVDTTTEMLNHSSLTLLLGTASNFIHQIHSADIIVCYSTAFASSYFSEAITALVLSSEWNDIITPPPIAGTTTARLDDFQKEPLLPLWCITTDKALDPQRGWKIMDRINVCNPEVLESTGFIQMFDRQAQN